ncbi:LrgB family protein [Facklamia hominis]|uniref:LrgB family protein n=1 Tax=Facklamia hominis TaxID=178214 RepID=UPI0038FC8176
MLTPLLNSPFLNTPLFGITLTVGMFLLGDRLHQRYPIVLFNPLVFSIGGIILLLMTTGITYDHYNQGAQLFSWLITPATVALAIGLEKNFDYLKTYLVPILMGCLSGTLIHTSMVIALAFLLRFNLQMVATVYPKSITTAIAISATDSLGGIVSLTIALVIATGTLGAILGPKLIPLCGIHHEVAQGVMLGTSAHAMGTSQAIKMGQVQGAMSSVALITTGITVIILTPAVNQILCNFFV